jgi:EmrB/QacA subfamily drug resistance transporter
MSPDQTSPHHDRRWLILAVIGVAQLMVVLDATIVNIALPSAQRDLGFSDDSRQWIITAYALAFGSLLLLGGKLGDLFGRKWTFIGGLLGFSIASALGGAAGTFGLLAGARALQGVFGAILAPSALALLSTTFTDPAERGKAFGIFGAIAGSGASVGLLLGGVLTETLDWRWCLYVNLLLAIPAALFAFRMLHNEVQPDRPRIDIPGTLAATGGLFALVYAFSNSETHSWGHPVTIIGLVVAAVLLTLFGAIQRRVEHPLLPLRIVRDRTRSGVYAAMGLSGAAMFAVFLFLTYFMQQNLGLTPIQTGLGFLPMTLTIMVTATFVNVRLLARVGPRPLMMAGTLLGAAALVWFAQLGPDSSYAGHVLPGLLVMGLGMANIFAPGFSTATAGVARYDTGVASAMINTMQQVGGSLGTALLSSIFAGAVTSYATSHTPGPGLQAAATVHGYTVAFWVAAGLFALAALAVTVLIRPTRQRAAAIAREGEPVAA